MKMTFRGWQREVTLHKHSVVPVDASTGKYVAKTINEPMTWNDSATAFGKVKNLSLSGSFLVEFAFEQTELKSWLEAYAKEHPAELLRMLAPIQTEALITLTKTVEASA